MGSATSVKVLEDGTANSGRPAKNHGHKSSASFFCRNARTLPSALFTRRLAPYYYFPECSHSLDTEPQHARAEATRDPPMRRRNRHVTDVVRTFALVLFTMFTY